jgi:phosphotransferase system HPr (HPr) family protein
MPASSDLPSDSAGLSSAPQERGQGDEVTQTVTLPESVALHARPAADLVRAASKLVVSVTIAANGKRANARSILEVLALGAAGGTELTLIASGPDAAEAVQAVADVVNGFGV